MSLYLQVSRECSKVWELFIDVAPWKTAQIIKTINISRCQWSKLDRFSFEFIAKIQLTWDAHVVQTRLSLLLFLFLLLSLYVCADAHVHLDLPCGIPISPYTQIHSAFLWILNSRETCGRINKFTHCYSLNFTQTKSDDIKMCNFISTRWNWQLKCFTE